MTSDRVRPGRDVAAFLGISERAVEGRLRRARIELTRVLADGHTDEAAASRRGSEEEVVP